MKVHYPRLEFKVADINRVIKPINGFLNNYRGIRDWSDKILNKYPLLRKRLEGVGDISRREKIAYDFFDELISSQKDYFEDQRKLFQEKWNRVEEGFMTTLPLVLEKDWSKEDKKIIGFVGPNPICPRDIVHRNFDIYYGADSDRLKGISAHEILHFLYFDKWKEVFPKSKRNHFEAPHLIWHLSEIVPKTILSDKKIQDFLRHTPRIHSEYEKIIINGKPLLSYIQEFYDGKKDFSDFLKKSYEFVKKQGDKLK